MYNSGCISRQVFPGPEVAVSLFLTGSEVWRLASHFSREKAGEDEEMVIYSKTSKLEEITEN